MALVSIIVPVHNGAATVHRAIESALQQTHQDSEVIVCDDGSTDSSVEILSGISDPRLRVIRNKENLGVGASRDLAIKLARGDWIAVLDADDAYRPDRIEKMLRAAGHDKDVVVFDDIDECLSVDGVLYPIQHLRGKYAFGAQGSVIDVPTSKWLSANRLLIKPMIPSSLIKQHSIQHSHKPYAEDTEFFIQLVRHGGRLRYLPEALYLYRKSAGTASSIATRHELMVEVLAEAKTWFSGDSEILCALMKRVSYEEHLSSYFHFLRHVKRWHLVEASRMLAANPKLGSELATRIAQTLKERVYLIRAKGVA